MDTVENVGRTQPISLSHLAKKLGVSRTVVSQVANNRTQVRISAETRAMVLGAMKEHRITRPHRATYRVCVVDPFGGTHEDKDKAHSLHPAFGERVNLGLRQGSSELGYALYFVLATGAWEERIANLLQTRSVDGVLLISRLSETIMAAAQQSRIPLVTVGFSDARFPFDSVGSDDEETVQLAVDALARRGCRDICYLGALTSIPGQTRLLDLFRARLRQMGLEFHPALVGECAPEIAGGLKEMRRLLDSGVKFDAVLGTNDYSLAGALQALAAAGRVPPNDVQLISYGGDPICRVVSPTIACVDIVPEMVAQRALQQLVRRIAQPDSPQERILLRPRLCPGETLRADPSPSTR